MFERVDRCPICFVETPEEVRALLAYCEEYPSPVLAIALTLDAQVLLRGHDFPFETTLSLFGREGHEEALLAAESLWARVKGQVDIRLESEVIRETFNDAVHFNIQYYVHHFVFVLRIVEAAIGKFRPSKVLYVTGPGALSSKPRHLLCPEERWASRVVELYCEAHRLPSYQIKGVVEPEEESVLADQPSVSRALRFAANALVDYARRSPCVLYSGSFEGFRSLSSQIRGSGRKLVLIDGKPLTWRGIAVSWIRALSGRGVVIPANPSLIKAADWTTDHERALDKKIEAFQAPSMGVEHKGVSFWRVYGEKVLHHLLPYQRSLASRVRLQLITASSLRISHVVVISAREMTYALCEYAGWRGIPSVMVSHGTAVAPKNRLEEIENKIIGSGLQLSPVVSTGALQSRLEEKHVEHYGSNGSLYRVGPILFGDRDPGGRLKARPTRNQEDDVTIVLASSCKNRSSYRFWAMETPDEYLASCREMIEAVNGLQGVRLVIRLHKKLSLPIGDLMTLFPESNRLTVEREGTFRDTLKSADLVVSFSSTTIEEAIQNKVPVLLYDPSGRYQHCDAAHFNRADDFSPSAVHYLSRRRQLQKALEVITERQLRGPQDSELFAPYCYDSEETIGFAEMLNLSAEEAGSPGTATLGASGRSCRIERKVIPRGVGDLDLKVLVRSPLQGFDTTTAAVEGGTGLAGPTTDSRG